MRALSSQCRENPNPDFVWSQDVILVSNHLPSLNHCLPMVHGLGMKSLPPWGDIQGKLEKTARSIEQLQCREYFVLDLSLVSSYEMETILFWLQCLLIGWKPIPLGWKTPLLCAVLLSSFFFLLNVTVVSSLFLHSWYLPSVTEDMPWKCRPQKEVPCWVQYHLLYCYGETGLLMMVSRKLGKTHPGVPLVPTLVWESHRGVRASCGRGEASWVMTSSGVWTRGPCKVNWCPDGLFYFLSA